MSNLDDEKDKNPQGQTGSGRPATKFMERPKPGQQPRDPSKSEEDTWEKAGEEGEREGGTETMKEGQQGQGKQGKGQQGQQKGQQQQGQQKKEGQKGSSE